MGQSEPRHTTAAADARVIMRSSHAASRLHPEPADAITRRDSLPHGQPRRTYSPGSLAVTVGGTATSTESRYRPTSISPYRNRASRLLPQHESVKRASKYANPHSPTAPPRLGRSSTERDTGRGVVVGRTLWSSSTGHAVPDPPTRDVRDSFCTDDTSDTAGEHISDGGGQVMLIGASSGGSSSRSIPPPLLRDRDDPEEDGAARVGSDSRGKVRGLLDQSSGGRRERSEARVLLLLHREEKERLVISGMPACMAAAIEGGATAAAGTALRVSLPQEVQQLGMDREQRTANETGAQEMPDWDTVRRGVLADATQQPRSRGATPPPLPTRKIGAHRDPRGEPSPPMLTPAAPEEIAMALTRRHAATTDDDLSRRNQCPTREVARSPLRPDDADPTAPFGARTTSRAATARTKLARDVVGGCGGGSGERGRRGPAHAGASPRGVTAPREDGRWDSAASATASCLVMRVRYGRAAGGVEGGGVVGDDGGRSPAQVAGRRVEAPAPPGPPDATTIRGCSSVPRQTEEQQRRLAAVQRREKLRETWRTNAGLLRDREERRREEKRKRLEEQRAMMQRRRQERREREERELRELQHRLREEKLRALAEEEAEKRELERKLQDLRRELRGGVVIRTPGPTAAPGVGDATGVAGGAGPGGSRAAPAPRTTSEAPPLSAWVLRLLRRCLPARWSPAPIQPTVAAPRTSGGDVVEAAAGGATRLALQESPGPPWGVGRAPLLDERAAAEPSGASPSGALTRGGAIAAAFALVFGVLVRVGLWRSGSAARTPPALR